MMLGSAKSEHPKLTNREIISDLFQVPTYVNDHDTLIDWLITCLLMISHDYLFIYLNITDRQTDGWTDRPLALAVPHSA